MQVVQIDCCLCQQCRCSIWTRRILRAQEFKLPHGVQHSLVPAKDASFFSQQPGHHVCSLRRLWVCRIAVVHAAVRIQHVLVLVPRARRFRPRFKRIPQLLRARKRRQRRMRGPLCVRSVTVRRHSRRAQQSERHRNYGRDDAVAADRRGEEPCRHRDRRDTHLSVDVTRRTENGCSPSSRKAETPFQLDQPHLQETCVRNQNTLIIGGQCRAKVRRKLADTYLDNLPISQ